METAGRSRRSLLRAEATLEPHGARRGCTPAATGASACSARRGANGTKRWTNGLREMRIWGPYLLYQTRAVGVAARRGTQEQGYGGRSEERRVGKECRS